MADLLSEEIRRALLAAARKTLVAAANGSCLETFPKGEGFDGQAAIFVTLSKNEKLRGCIGRFVADRPLGVAVRDMTWEAARSDPRFAVVTPEELSEIRIEISRLTEPVVARVDEVSIGRHGLIVEKGSKRGLLLPRVATDLNCDVPQFLALACQKAHLPPDAWHDDDIEIRVFETEVFAE